MTKDDGSTKAPQDEAEAAAKRAECMGRYKHSFKWVWEGATWTNKVRCTTCGEVQVRDRSQA
jgi:hypothetical protein